MYDIEKIYYQLLRIEERLNNLENKQWFRTQINEHKRILASEYSNHLNNLIKELGHYSPKNQMNLKKALLKGLPNVPMKMNKYRDFILSFIDKKRYKDFNWAEYEITLKKLDLISPEDELDIMRIDSKLLELVISIL